MQSIQAVNGTCNSIGEAAEICRAIASTTALSRGTSAGFSVSVLAFDSSAKICRVVLEVPATEDGALLSRLLSGGAAGVAGIRIEPAEIEPQAWRERI